MDNPVTRLGNASKSILMVLFVPSVERDGKTSIDQDYWVNEALETFGCSGEPPPFRERKAYGGMTNVAAFSFETSRSSSTATSPRRT